MSGHISQDDRDYPHYAMIYIDHNGNLRHESSPSVANNFPNPQVTNEFLRAVARSGEASPSHSQLDPGARPSPTQRGPSLQATLPQTIGRLPHGGDMEARMPMPAGQGPPIQPLMWSVPHVPTPVTPGESIRRRKSPWSEEFGLANQKASISIKDKDVLRRYYEKVFQNLQQTNCRVIAKAYVKLVEPRKQVNYPYNGRKIVAGSTQQLSPDETKPPWWPSGVSHREPDHLPKVERIRLLVHILCELRTSHGITAQRLKEADQPIRRQISPAERLRILDEVYQVREEEEKYVDGETDGETTVSISRANLPDADTGGSQSGRSRRSSLQDDTSSQKSPSDKLSRGGIPPQSSGTSGETPEMPTDPNPNPNLNPNPNPNPTHTPMQTIQQELPIHPGVHHAGSVSPQDLKRKRASVDAGSSMNVPTSFDFYHPVYVDSQQFVPDTFGNPQFIPQQSLTPTSVPTCGPGHGTLSAEPFNELIENFGYPYYFEN